MPASGQAETEAGFDVRRPGAPGEAGRAGRVERGVRAVRATAAELEHGRVPAARRRRAPPCSRPTSGSSPVASSVVSTSCASSAGAVTRSERLAGRTRPHRRRRPRHRPMKRNPAAPSKNADGAPASAGTVCRYAISSAREAQPAIAQSTACSIPAATRNPRRAREVAHEQLERAAAAHARRDVAGHHRELVEVRRERRGHPVTSGPDSHQPAARSRQPSARSPEPSVAGLPRRVLTR